MKNSIIVILIFTWSFCLGQNNKVQDNPQLNHLLSPVQTEVVFDFGEGLLKETDFDMDYRRMVLLPNNIDTTLDMGTKGYKVKLPLERPTLVRIHIADQWDHLFLVPDQNTNVVYNPLKNNQDRIDVTGPEIIEDLNNYYDARFKLLGVSREIFQAYWVYNHLYLKPMDAKKGYDSLADKQYDLLNKYSHKLPEWFVQFENKGIKYMTETFKLSAVARKNLDEKGHYINDYSSFELSHDLNDTIGVLTNFYISSLGELGYLDHCNEDCFDDLEVRLPAMYKAILSMAEDIMNPEIRQILLAKNLIRIYVGSHALPDILVQEFESRLEKPYLDMVSIYKNPSLIGQKASSFYLSDPAGEFHTLKTLNGQVVLLNFWFVGCKPCEQELPYEKTLTGQLQNEEFKLVNICTNTPESTWKEFVQENAMPGLNLYAQGNWGNKLADSYQLSAYPTYVLIDKEGKVVLDKAPRPSGEQLIQEIRKRL